MREATQASSERWRWIPNTGEFLVLDNVAVRVRNKAGLALPLDSGYTIRLKGAYDRFWDANNCGDANGNIYNNKAMGINAATLNLGGSIASTATLSTITVANGERLYSAASDDIGSFTVSKGGWLERDGMRARLGLRPLSSETAYPGDDYVLAFTVEYAPGGSGTPVTLEARTDAKDYVAVYDKKLLWRANLYIAETNGQDWNDMHPWVEGNEWNPIGDDGKQDVITIAPWSSFWGKGKNPYNSVAYSIGSMDSPQEFNRNIENEVSEMDKFAQKNLAYGVMVKNRIESKAPDDLWKNYVFPAREKLTNLVAVPPNRVVYGAINENTIGQFPQHLFYRIGSTAKIPGLSSYIMAGDDQIGLNVAGPGYSFTTEGDVKNFQGQLVGKILSEELFTTGTDCSGFLSTAANYKDNPYKLGGAHIVTAKLSTAAYSVCIQPVIDDNSDLELPFLKYAVPGDILNRSGDHVVIVSQILPDQDGTVDSRSQIKVIQSGAGRKGEWQVIPSLEWNTESGMGAGKWWKYELRRLRTK